MPELPEVETIKKGLESICLNQVISESQVYTKQLRYPIQQDLPQIIKKQRILELKRRGKYLIVLTKQGGLIFHFGMSGRIYNKKNLIREKHEHFIMRLESGEILSFYDPRKFGLVLWSKHPVLEHFCLKKLGLEALSEEFNGIYLYGKSRNREVKIKNLIMDNNTVVGVGNIYASEALYMAKIMPNRAAKRLSFEEYELLCESIKAVLSKAIDAGGTTIRDFKNYNGELGYFAQKLMVYGRAGQLCKLCNHQIKKMKILNRSTFYCENCQK